MSNNVQAAIEAAVARHDRPTPKFVKLGSLTEALTELRGKLAAGIRAHATILGRQADSAVKQIDQVHDEEVSREILYCHQYSGLDLYLDTDGTDTGLRRVPPGDLDAKAIDRGWASTNGEAGPLVALLSDLDAFAQKFLADRGYSEQADSQESSKGQVSDLSSGLTGPLASEPHPRRRCAYKVPLTKWMASKPLADLVYMGPAAIAKMFEEERPDLRPLLPKRLRGMEPMIERIVTRRRDLNAASKKVTAMDVNDRQRPASANKRQ